MYEDEYLLLKDNIYEIIKEKEKIKQKNRSKCRSVPVVIVWEGEVIKKSSIKEISDYMAIQYGIVNVKNWFKSRGVPQKYSDKVSFCGTLDDFKSGAE